MNFSILNIIRLIILIITFTGIMLLGGELYFIVTNSNSIDDNEPPQDLSSGLFNARVDNENSDYTKMKAKGGLMIDFDWDNDLDIFFGYRFAHYFENINGVYEERTEFSGISLDGLTGVVAGDIDNNGYQDILKMRFVDTLANILELNLGNNIFNTVEYLPSPFLLDIHGQGLLDADLDGDLDIFSIQDEGSQQAFLFLNQGNNPFGEPEFLQAFTYDADETSSSRTMAIIDYDNDGDQDIFVVRKFGINWLLENQTLTGVPGNVTYNENPNPYFIEVATDVGVDDFDADPAGSMGYGAGWGDYDNDEDFDLYLANWGDNKLFNSDFGMFNNIIDETETFADSLNNGLSWSDLDNSGNVELWISNIKSHDNIYYNNFDGQGWDSTSSPLYSSATQDVITGDYNNDGMIDVFTAGLEMNEDDESDTTISKYTSLLYKNITVDSTGIYNNWIKIKLEGGKYGTDNINGWTSLANKSAIGARITINTSSGNQIREIIASKGHGSMNPLIQHFGLGNNSFINSITINWPSKDTLTNQPKIIYYEGPFEANKIYTIVEHLGFVGLKGDSNQDNEIDVLDVVRTINEVILEDFLSPSEHWAVDMNYDLYIDILDIVRLVEFLLSP